MAKDSLAGLFLHPRLQSLSASVRQALFEVPATSLGDNTGSKNPVFTELAREWGPLVMNEEICWRGGRGAGTHSAGGGRGTFSENIWTETRVRCGLTLSYWGKKVFEVAGGAGDKPWSGAASTAVTATVS